MKNKPTVCPVEKAGMLENPIRKWMMNPLNWARPYIKDGVTVLDLGCGPGFFTVEVAKLLKDSGKVIAADVQQGMLDKVSSKITGTDLAKRVTLHKCSPDEIGITEKVDLVLAFYVIHEVPDCSKLFDQLGAIVNPGGNMLIVEPKFHVTKKTFRSMVETLKQKGWEIANQSAGLFSRTIILTKI